MKTKILVLRFSSIGDIILTTPVLRCIKEQWDGKVEIHYLTKSVFKPLLEHNPHIDQLHTFDERVEEVLPALEKKSFHYIIDLHHNVRSLKVKKKLKTLAFSFPKLNWEKWLYVNFKRDKLPKVHIVDRYFETLKNFGIVPDGKGLEVHLGPTEFGLKKWTGKEGRYVAVAIGGSYFTKRMSETKLVEICSRIEGDVVLLGGHDDEDVGRAVAAKSGKNVFNLCGKLSLMESAAAVKGATTVLSNDTGLMHMAAAFQKPIISVWGNTTPKFGMSPYLPVEGSQVFEVDDLGCRPCSKLGFRKCPKGHFNCMELQDSLAISDALNNGLAS